MVLAQRIGSNGEAKGDVGRQKRRAPRKRERGATAIQREAA